MALKYLVAIPKTGQEEADTPLICFSALLQFFKSFSINYWYKYLEYM